MDEDRALQLEFSGLSVRNQSEYNAFQRAVLTGLDTAVAPDALAATVARNSSFTIALPRPSRFLLALREPYSIASVPEAAVRALSACSLTFIVLGAASPDARDGPPAEVLVGRVLAAASDPSSPLRGALPNLVKATNASVPSSVQPDVPDTAAAAAVADAGNSGSSDRAKRVGLGVGLALAVLACICGAAVWLHLRRRRRSQNVSSAELVPMTGDRVSLSESHTLQLQQQDRFGLHGQPIRHTDFDESSSPSLSLHVSPRGVEDLEGGAAAAAAGKARVRGSQHTISDDCELNEEPF